MIRKTTATWLSEIEALGLESRDVLDDVAGVDNQVVKAIEAVAKRLLARGEQHVASVIFGNRLSLGWSRATRGSEWRFVVRDDEGATDLLSVSSEERLQVFENGAFLALVTGLLTA